MERSKFNITQVNEEDSASEGSCVEEEENVGEYSLQHGLTRDIFSPTTCPSPSEALEWMKENYGFDLESIVRAHNWNMYSCIKVVNFCRKYVKEAKESSGSYHAGECAKRVADILTDPNNNIWDTDDNLVPLQEYSPDPLLTFFDIDDDSDSEDEQDGGFASSPQIHSEETTSSIVQLQNRVKQLETELSQLGQRICDQPVNESELVAPIPASSHVAGNSEEPDKYYFDSYSHLDIHEEMLKDTVRTLAYRDAIEKNPGTFQGKVVVDVGCGTGILSLFAARAGANSVIGIDNSQMALGARKVVERNGYSGVITVIKDRVENVSQLPETEHGDGKADIIISEWMGYALLFESMLDSVLHIRDRLLRKGGRVFPNKALIFVEGLESQNRLREREGFWNDVYGFDMSCLVENSEQEGVSPRLESEIEVPDVLVINPDTVCTNRAMLHEIDIETVQANELDFESEFKLVATKASTVSGIAISFDCLFTGRDTDTKIEWEHDVVLPTGVQDKPTHWQQTRLLLRESLQLAEGDELQGTLCFSRNTSNPREIDMKLRLTSTAMSVSTGLPFSISQLYHMK